MARTIKPAEERPIVTAEAVEAVPVLPDDGDEVLFHASAGRWVLAEVVGREKNGELVLLCDLGDDLIHQRAMHSTQLHGWLTYDEAARLLTGA